MKKVIIGIHGLKNKPDPETLKKWWKASIYEGLGKHGYSDDFKFEMAYWADLDYPKPLDPNQTDPEHPLFIPAPYSIEVDAEEQKENSSLKKKILINLEASLDHIFLRENSLGGLEKIADKAMQRMFSDLDIYYHGFCQYRCSQTAKSAFRQRLADLLHKYRHQNILLIGHSMGSIIGYDTLTQLTPDISIESFLTLGSPLGLPIIIKKILQEQNQEVTPESKPITPENIRNKWWNFADLDDKVALIYRIANDYAPNSQGLIPEDFQVDNRYQFGDEINPHKAYGYLRTPEVSEHISKFLTL